ncbi:MAG: surface-adhesin E family protein [Ramlibacter sp.]
MKMRMALVLLACISGTALAQWTELGVASQRNTTYFLDLTTLEKAPDGKVTVSYLFDLKTARECDNQPNLYLSSTGDHEVDCKAKMYRVVSCTRYSQNMAKGDVVSVTNEPNEWSGIPPHSKFAKMYKVVCGAAR